MWSTLSGRLALVLASLFLAGGAALMASSMPMPQLRELLEAGIGLLAASIAFAMLVALLVFRLLARRLHLLAREMDDFRSSRFTRPKHLAWARDDGDEIDRLACTFGQMSHHIAQQFAELERHDAQRRELLANVSHDLRTPLTLMQGYLETLLMRRGERDPAEERSCLEVSARHAERLGRLVADLFELAKLDGRAGRIQPEAFSLTELAQDGPRDLSIVYTPLHGVGGTTVAQVLETAGFDAPHVVEQQEHPDPDFPTVSFPNPEEPGAMDLAMALAAEHRADLVVANDPDADRCAVAVPDAHGWRMLRGDEVGALLAHHLIARGRTGTYANSIVSSSLLGKMAAAAGQPHEETLTGFKWIGRVEGLAFGYEEALGYCCDPEHVRDKDGVSALLLVCELAAEAKAAGRTVRDLLDDIARTHGLYATDQLSVRLPRTRPFRYATSAGRLEPARSEADEQVTYRWQARHCQRLAQDENLPPREELRP